jgi:hypothetical protein
MKRSVWLSLAIAINAIIASVSQAQIDSWTALTDGKWESAKDWDNGLPSIPQSAVIISNANSKVVTINGYTAFKFSNSLTISNLIMSAQEDVTNTLFLDSIDNIALQILNGLTIGISPDYPSIGGTELISTKSTLIVDGLLGGQLEDDGTMIFMGGSLITTNCSLQIAVIGFPNTSGGLLIISNSVVQARDVSIGTGENISGSIEVIGGTMTLSSTLDVGDGFNSPGTFLVANGGLLVVTNGETGMGGFSASSGIMTVSNATFLGADVFLGGGRSDGELTINNGTVTLNGQLGIGDGEQGSGNVELNGGKLVVTNGATSLGLGSPSGLNTMVVSDGLFLARDIYVGSLMSDDSFLITGGISILSSNLEIGSYNSGVTVSITGGQLFVTNAPVVVHDGAVCSVSGGKLLARTIVIGVSLYNGLLSINSGLVKVSEGITLGDCNDDLAIGYVSVDGGQLIVTNAAHTGFIDIQNGQLVLSNGVLRVDKLVMTNSCSSFVHTGGTLIAGSVVLDPNAFAITSVAREGNDLLITWLMAPGATNALQVSSGGIHGNYLKNAFADIFVVTNNTTTGTLTNYLDIGAATNQPSRYYRARLSL